MKAGIMQEFLNSKLSITFNPIILRCDGVNQLKAIARVSKTIELAAEKAGVSPCFNPEACQVSTDVHPSEGDTGKFHREIAKKIPAIFEDLKSEIGGV